MARNESAISHESTHIVRQVLEGNITSSHGLTLLLKVALKCVTIGDLEYIRIARENIEEYEANSARAAEPALSKEFK